MNSTKDLVKNTLIIAVGKLSTQFLVFLLLPIYTNFLSPKDFGVVDLIMTYVGIFVPLMAVSIERAAFRHLIDARQDKEQQARIITNSAHIYFLSFLILTILFTIAQYLIVIPYGWLVYGVIIAVSLSNFLMQIARGFGDNIKFSIAGVIAGVITIIMNIALIVGLGWGADAMLLSVLIANIAAAGYLIIGLNIKSHIKPKLSNFILKKELFGYSLPLVPSNIAWWVIGAADRTIITVFLGAASNGLYAVAYKFPQIFSSLFSFFSMSWQESASVNANSEDKDRFYSHTMNASIKIFGALGLLIIAGTGLFFEVLVGRGFHEARQYIPILILGILFYSVLEIYSGIYIAKKWTRKVFKTSAMAALINIGLTLCFIPWLGLFAPTIAMPIAYLVMSIMRHYELKNYVRISYETRTIIKMMLLYMVVSGLYYCNSLFTNIFAIVIASIAMILLNRNFIILVWTRIYNKLVRPKC